MQRLLLWLLLFSSFALRAQEVRVVDGSLVNTQKLRPGSFEVNDIRAAQGAHFLLNIVEGEDVVAFAQRYAGRSLALMPRGIGVGQLYDVDMTGPTAILIGNEGSGLSPELIAAATLRVSIPMPGRVESLNAAAAGAICMFEMTRQRAMSK